MEPEAESVRCEDVLDSNEGARRVPDLDVFSGGREDEVLKLAEAEMEILRRQAGLVQNKFYRNIWNKFVSEFGVWLRRNDEPVFLESFLSLSSRTATLEAGFWLLGGFLSIGSPELQESSRGRILEILKLVHLSHSQSVHCLKKREYRFVVSLYSKFFQEYSPDTWREWILAELSAITGSQGLTSPQRLILDIALHYVENIHSDEGLTSELVLGVANGLPSIFASDVDSCFRMSLESIARALPSCGKELSPLVNALLRQLKRYSSKPCSQVSLLEGFIHHNTIQCLQTPPVLRDVLSILSEAISVSIGGILSSGNKNDQGCEDVHIIQSSLDICFQLIPSHFELEEWLEETALTILSSKTTDQVKVSLLLVVASIHECLARRRLEGVSVSFDITPRTQDLLLSLVDIKLPMVSSQSSDHLKALAVHICSLSYVLLNGSRSHPFSGKFLDRIQSLIGDQSISDACRLLVVSSFAHSILLLKKLGVTSSFDKSKVSQIIISSGHVSGLFGSALSKTANLKRLSIIVLGQLVSIQDVLGEADIFKSLDVVQSLQSSSQLLPRLGALVEGSYSLAPCSTNVAEASILMVLMEVMFSPSSASNFSIEFQRSQDGGSMDLRACLQTMASPNKIQSANYLIGFLIQMGRVMSFMPDNGDLSVSLAQYSAVNMEAFQASLMLPGLKRPIVSCAGGGGSLQEASHLPVSWAGLRELGSFFGNESFCRSLILAFATILGSFNSLIRREEEQGGRSDEASSELLLRKIDLFKVWVFLGRLEMLSKDGPSKIGCQYYAIFLLCSYHPLLYSGCSPLGDREERPGGRHSAAVHGDVIRDLVKVWHGSEETRRAVNEALLEVYLDLVYLPVDEATGFRVAGMNLLNILKLTKDSGFTLCLVERLKLQVKNSLEFLNSLPREFGDFVVSDPSQPFEFNLHLAGPQSPDQGFIQDMEGSISARLKSFTGDEAKYGDFSEVYSSIASASSWLGKSLSSLDADSSLARTGERDSGEKPAPKGRDSEPEPGSKGPGSGKTAGPTKPATASSPNPATTATSAFALAKLRKSQADSKAKAGKPTKAPTPHACSANAKGHANSHTGGSLSTCSGGAGVNSSACGSNLTKEEIWRQRLGEQGNLRRAAERIVSRIRIGVEEMLGVLVSCVSGADGRSEEVGRMDLEMSEVLYLVCSRMLEFKPLRHYGLCILERLVLESNRLGRVMVDYLSRQDEEGRDACLQEMFDLVSSRGQGSADSYLRSSSGVSILVYIISRVLYTSCEERRQGSDRQVQISGQLIQYLSGCMRHGGLRVSIMQLANMLYLYVLALGDLAELDQYLHPLRMLVSELRPSCTAEVDLISSMLIFASPKIRLIVLESLKRALDGSKMEISYFALMNLSVAREVQVFSVAQGSSYSEEELAYIAGTCEELIGMCGGAARDEQSVRLVDDLIEIQVAPVVSALQQRNISRSILRVSGGECCYSSTVEKVVARSSRVFDGFDKRRVFSAGDWPSALTRSLISSMVPSTIRHFDSVLPRFGDASLGKMVSRIQARHALRGLVFTLSDLVASLDGSDSRLIELCIRFVLTQVVDSVVFEDYVSEAERMSASGTADEGLKGKDKAVRNLVGSFGGRQDSPEKIQIQNSDVSSRESLQEAVIGLFVSLSSRPDIQSLSSGILTILRDLSSQYKPRISPREFHNCLAFAIGSIASCCSSSDPVVYTVTCKIMNELLGGSLVRNGGGAEAHDSASKTRLPVLEDIPQEYSRILPRLFSMLYGSQEARQEPTLCRFEALDRDKYLDYRMDSGDSPGAEKLSVYEIYSISLCKALYSESPAERVGAAHIFGSLSKGISARRLRDFGILEAMEGVLRSPDGQKSSEAGSLEGVLLCIGSLSLYLGYMIEPYTIQFLKSLMHLFSGGDQRIRFYSEKSAEVIIKNLSRFGARLILPIITQGIEEKQWRIKLTSLQLLGIMALNSPHQLSSYLPKAIQTIYQTSSDSHPKVSEAARETLLKMVSLIKNPEISCISQDLTTSLIDPTEQNFKRALLSLKSVTFVHAIDITTLSLIFPVLLKAIQERGGTDLKKDAIQVLTCLLLLLSDRSDVDPFLPLIENSIHITLTDPIPEIRLLTAKLCRALVTVTGQEKSSSLLSWLFRTLAMEVGQTLKSGVSASLAEVLSAFGIDKFKKILPFIVSQIQKMDDDGNGDDESPPHPGDASDPVSSSGPASAASVREGYIGLFVYLPQSFGEDLGPLMPGILPVLLSRLGDEVDSVREVALKACKALVVQFGSDHAAYILQPLEEGLGSDNWRVRLSSCSLLGTLLNRLIKGQLDATGRALSVHSSALGEAGFSMHRRSYILAAIYMARSDENVSVKNSAAALWKSLVQNTPQTLKDILTILIRRIINALSASSSGNAHYIAVQSLKDLLDKFGSAFYNKLLPIFYQNLGGSLRDDGTMDLDSGSAAAGSGQQIYGGGGGVSPNRSVRVGSCIGVLEILRTVRRADLKGLVPSFLPVIKMGLRDQDLEVRTYAVESLDIFASENSETLFSTIDWLMDAILSEEESCVEAGSSEQDDPRISAIELIVQLSHAGIVSSILPRVVSGRMTANKIRIIKSMSRIPSQSRLRSSLFDIVPRLIETSVDLDGNCDDLVRDLSREAMVSIVQSLETQGMEAFVTILLDIIRQNTPSTNLSISGRYQIESLKIRDLEELVQRRETLTRVRSIEFLTFSLFGSSPVYDTSFSMLIKYLVPLAMCDVSEDVRISASKAFHLFSISVPRKSVIQVCSVMRETIASLVHDPIDNSKHFAGNKLVGSSWRILDGKVTRVVSGDGGPSEQLLASSNKFIDSLTALYVQGISQGSPDSKEECATALREVIQLTNTESLRPIAVKLVGPLIRSISDRTTASLVRGALLSNLVIFLESCGAQLRPLLPQIQTILLKFLLDPSESVRRQCSQGIGFLYRLLGNRAEVLLGDLCSLAGKQSQSEESVKALLSSISLSLLSGGETRPVVSEALRNRLIGLALSMLEESKDATIRDTSGQILSSVLISYCQEEEIRDILTPLITATGDQDGDQPSRDRNLLNILNCCCESDGWRRLYSSLAGLEESVSPVFGDDEMDSCLSPENKERMLAGRPVPRQVLASPSWWIYKKTVVMLYKIMVDGSGGSSGSQLKKLALGFLYNLTKTSIRDQDSFSVSIVLQTLANLLEKDLLSLFPTFADASLILDIQRICEMIIESDSSRDLFLQEIQSNLVCYSFGGACADAKTGHTISHQDILVSLVSIPSVQSLNSKFPAVKLKAEQLLVFIIKLAAKLNKDGDQSQDQDYQCKFNLDSASQCDAEDPPSLFELVISDIIAVIQRMYPHLLSQQKVNFTKEYSRRVLAKADL